MGYCTDQHYRRQWLSNTEWLNSRRWDWAKIDGYGRKHFEKRRILRRESEERHENVNSRSETDDGEELSDDGPDW